MVKVSKANSINFGFWNGLGGKVDANESPEECVIREVYEESGLKIKDPTLKGIITYPDNNGTGDTWYVIVYVAKKFSGKLQLSPEGDLKWISTKDLGKLKVHQSDQYFFKWLNKKKVFSAKFLYSGKKGEHLVGHEVSFY